MLMLMLMEMLMKMEIFRIFHFSYECCYVLTFSSHVASQNQILHPWCYNVMCNHMQLNLAVVCTRWYLWTTPSQDLLTLEHWTQVICFFNSLPGWILVEPAWLWKSRIRRARDWERPRWVLTSRCWSCPTLSKWSDFPWHLKLLVKRSVQLSYLQALQLQFH